MPLVQVSANDFQKSSDEFSIFSNHLSPNLEIYMPTLDLQFMISSRSDPREDDFLGLVVRLDVQGPDDVFVVLSKTLPTSRGVLGEGQRVFRLVPSI